MKADQETEFRSFVEAAIPRLRRLALAASRDQHRADDLVQTTLEKLYAAWPRMHAVGDPHAYARTVLVRSLISEQRRHWWSRGHSVEDAGTHEAAPDRDHAQRLDLEAALGALPTRQRMAVVLRHLEDLPVSEVARLMQCSEGTVKSTTSDGLRALRASLESVAGQRK